MALICQNYHFLYEYYVAKFKVSQGYLDTLILQSLKSQLNDQKPQKWEFFIKKLVKIGLKCA